jgi:hypothetical protein
MTALVSLFGTGTTSTDIAATASKAETPPAAAPETGVVVARLPSERARRFPAAPGSRLTASLLFPFVSGVPPGDNADATHTVAGAALPPPRMPIVAVAGPGGAGAELPPRPGPPETVREGSASSDCAQSFLNAENTGEVVELTISDTGTPPLASRESCDDWVHAAEQLIVERKKSSTW